MTKPIIHNQYIFNPLKTAKAQNLMQLTKWLNPTREEKIFLVREYERFCRDPDRTAMLTYDKGLVALFVNRVV